MPDVVVSHEPGAVEKSTSAGVLVNGHLHTDQLEGNRIGVGTFTGGGTVSHFVQDAEKSGTGDEGELDGSALRVRHRRVRSDCTLTSLTRYTYRNLIQGRPAYDDVQVINGSTIQPQQGSEAPRAPRAPPAAARRERGSRGPRSPSPRDRRRRPSPLTAGDPGGDPPRASQRRPLR